MAKVKNAGPGMMQATPENVQRHNHYILTVMRLERLDPPDLYAKGGKSVSAELFRSAVGGDYAGSPLTSRHAFEFFKAIDETRPAFGNQTEEEIAGLRREQLRVFLGRLADADAGMRECVCSPANLSDMRGRFVLNLRPDAIGYHFDRIARQTVKE